MVNPLISGFGLIFLSAFAGGTFAVPLRLRRRYQWENMWMLGLLFATIIIPLIMARFALPNWPSAISAVGPVTVAMVMAFGFGWGTASVTFALGITSIGLSVGYAIIMGLNTAIGSIIPMMRRWSEVPGDARVVILLGIMLCIGGVAICGRAGMLRERATSTISESHLPFSERSEVSAFRIGLACCILSGVLSACANLGFDFADKVAEETQRLGANPVFASLSRWIAVYWGGFLAVLLWCSLIMLKNRTWKNFVGPGAGHDFVLTITLAVGHFLAQIPYGMGAYYLGKLGTTVGWAVCIASSLVVANALGFITGEWKDAPKLSTRTLYLGLATLIFAMIILAYGNSMVSG